MRRARSRSRQQRPEGLPPPRRANGRGSHETAPVAGEVLRLQRSGGNDAVTTMLAQRDLFDDDETEVDQTEEEAGFEQTDIEQAGPGFEEGGGDRAGSEQAESESDQSALEEGEAEEETVGAPGSETDSTLLVDDPIGAVPLISSSQLDSAGQQFRVRVRSSSKDPLLFAAAAANRSIGTVRFGSTVLQNVVIGQFSAGGVGSPIDMTLTSGPAPAAPVASTLVMADPIGALPLISSQPVGQSGLAFDVVVASSAKDALLFGAAVSGQSVGTVKLSTGGGIVTLVDVLITSISSAGQAGANLSMSLNARSKK